MVLKKLLKKPGAIIILLLLVGLPACIPLLSKGFYEPHDLHHFADIYQMVRGFQSGQIPPRWGPDFIYGFGYPLFNFYYVLPFYLGTLFFFVFGSIITSFKLVFLTTILLSLVGMYLFLREFVGKYASFVGSVLFLYTPYKAVQIYVRGAMGEAFALSVLPFVLWILVRALKKNNPKNISLSALLIALFILSHNYLWAISLPFIILFLIMLKKYKIFSSFKVLAVSAILGLGLSAYWWLPALIESSLVASKTPFPLIDHFPFVKQLILPSWGYGSSVWGSGDEISFQIGILNLFVLALGVVIYIIYKNKFKKALKPLFLWSTLGFLISLVFMNSRTYFIWKLIPFHDFIQFPWRLLIFTTLFTSIMAAVLVEVAKEKKKKIAGALIILASILLTFSYFKPSSVFYKNDNDYLNRFFANRSLEGEKSYVSREYQQYSEDYLLLPNWTEEKPNQLPSLKYQVANGKILEEQEIKPLSIKLRVFTEEESIITFNNLYFPGWFAKVDDKKASISPGEPYGQIEVTLPEGIHNVSLFWRETNLRLVADAISLASLIILLLVFKKKINVNKILASIKNLTKQK